MALSFFCPREAGSLSVWDRRATPDALSSGNLIPSVELLAGEDVPGPPPVLDWSGGHGGVNLIITYVICA